MPPVRTPALILHAFPYGDTSRILRLLTPEYGLRSVIAKGAMSPRSRFGGVLEPFTEGEAEFNLRPGRDLFVLSGFSLIRPRQGIGRDFAAFTGASLIAEIMLRFGTEEPSPELYDAVVAAFDRLAGPPPETAADVAVAALWNLSALLGFRPVMTHCVRCDGWVGDHATTRFDAPAGGVVCTRCDGGHGPAVTRETRIVIEGMAETASGILRPADRRRHAELLNAFLSAHLFQGQSLRSLRLFLDQFE